MTHHVAPPYMSSHVTHGGVGVGAPAAGSCGGLVTCVRAAPHLPSETGHEAVSIVSTDP
jgi:hypothetical protein